MKTFLLAALVAAAALSGAGVANADTFTVHGYQGNDYGR
jgi:hypothetical protein